MKFVEYSIQWAKGEMFEGMCIAIGGLVALVCTFFLWKYGNTINARALVIPSLVFGLLFSLMGSYMIYSNNQRTHAFQAAYASDSAAFLQSEKKRVEDFQFLYPTSLAISAVCFIVTLIAFVWGKSPNFQGIGIVLSIFGLSLIIIDFFSKERAAIYYEQILKHL